MSDNNLLIYKLYIYIYLNIVDCEKLFFFSIGKDGDVSSIKVLKAIESLFDILLKISMI